MSTQVVNEFHAKPGRGDDVLALLLRLSPESATRPGCEAISIRRNLDDPDNLVGDTRWSTRQHYDDYLAWRTEHGFTAQFDEMLDRPMEIRYFEELSSATGKQTDLDGVVAEHIAAVNACDQDAIMATFADDALVNDARREFWGTDAIAAWVAKELVGDNVKIEVTEALKHRDQIIVRGRYDGTFDKSQLPAEIILTNYFTVRDGKIVGLIVIRNAN